MPKRCIAVGMLLCVATRQEMGSESECSDLAMLREAVTRSDIAGPYFEGRYGKLAASFRGCNEKIAPFFAWHNGKVIRFFPSGRVQQLLPSCTVPLGNSPWPVKAQVERTNRQREEKVAPLEPVEPVSKRSERRREPEKRLHSKSIASSGEKNGLIKQVVTKGASLDVLISPTRRRRKKKKKKQSHRKVIANSKDKKKPKLLVGAVARQRKRHAGRRRELSRDSSGTGDLWPLFLPFGDGRTPLGRSEVVGKAPAAPMLKIQPPPKMSDPVPAPVLPNGLRTSLVSSVPVSVPSNAPAERNNLIRRPLSGSAPAPPEIQSLQMPKTDLQEVQIASEQTQISKEKQSSESLQEQSSWIPPKHLFEPKKNSDVLKPDDSSSTKQSTEQSEELKFENSDRKKPRYFTEREEVAVNFEEQLINGASINEEKKNVSASDTGSSDTGSSDTGSSDTGSSDTGSIDTGSSGTGSSIKSLSDPEKPIFMDATETARKDPPAKRPRHDRSKPNLTPSKDDSTQKDPHIQHLSDDRSKPNLTPLKDDSAQKDPLIQHLSDDRRRPNPPLTKDNVISRAKSSSGYGDLRKFEKVWDEQAEEFGNRFSSDVKRAEIAILYMWGQILKALAKGSFGDQPGCLELQVMKYGYTGVEDHPANENILNLLSDLRASLKDATDVPTITSILNLLQEWYETHGLTHRETLKATASANYHLLQTNPELRYLMNDFVTTSTFEEMMQKATKLRDQLKSVNRTHEASTCRPSSASALESLHDAKDQTLHDPKDPSEPLSLEECNKFFAEALANWTLWNVLKTHPRFASTKEFQTLRSRHFKERQTNSSNWAALLAITMKFLAETLEMNSASKGSLIRNALMEIRTAEAREKDAAYSPGFFEVELLSHFKELSATSSP